MRKWVLGVGTSIWVHTSLASKTGFRIWRQITDKVDSAFAESTRVKYEDMERHILEQIEQQKAENYKIFVATDEQSFVDFLKEKFPNKVITTNCRRSSDGTPLHMNNSAPYQTGKEALLDCMLLASGDALLCTSSNLSLFATYVNPDIPVVEVSHRLPTKHAKNMNRSIHDEGLKC